MLLSNYSLQRGCSFQIDLEELARNFPGATVGQDSNGGKLGRKVNPALHLSLESYKTRKILIYQHGKSSIEVLPPFYCIIGDIKQRFQ